MKMISSAKMHKAEMTLRQLVPFRNQVETVISNLLSSDAVFSSPLLDGRQPEHITVVVWGSDDGLCGAYNVNIYKQLVAHLVEVRSQMPQVKINIVAVGSKMLKACRKISLKEVTVESVDGIDSKSDDKGSSKLSQLLTERFVAKETDRVDYLYMNFQSVSRQRPKLDCFLPVTYSVFVKEKAPSAKPYIFEPDAATIFNRVLPLYLVSLTQEVFCENRASEQAARVMAMQSANDNAKKLLDQLRLEYNKLRQQSITNELLDIVGGQINQ